LLAQETFISKMIHPVIHHHFRLLRAFLQNPARFKKVAFESIPFFQLYAMREVGGAREAIETLSRAGMPHYLQKVAGRLSPSPYLAQNRYRSELIPLTYCVHNRQGLFARAYRLRAKEFFKIEITFHSEISKGRGKYLDLDAGIRSAERVFAFFNKDISPLHPLGRHLDEYFLIEDFQKEVGAIEKGLLHLKQVSNERIKEALKERFINQVQTFEKEAKEIAKEKLRSIKMNKVIRADLDDSR
jgi:hypothetical protein